MAISDNGASAEGGPTGSVNESKWFNFFLESVEENLKSLDDLGGPEYFNHFAWGWTWAGNTPFRRWKRETYRGGISDPFMVHYPDGIEAKGQVRMQYTHAIDMVPTVLDLVGLEPPTSIKGVTQAPSKASALPTRLRTLRYPAGIALNTLRRWDIVRSTMMAGAPSAPGLVPRSPRRVLVLAIRSRPRNLPN